LQNFSEELEIAIVKIGRVLALRWAAYSM